MSELIVFLIDSIIFYYDSILFSQYTIIVNIRLMYVIQIMQFFNLNVFVCSCRPAPVLQPERQPERQHTFKTFIFLKRYDKLFPLFTIMRIILIILIICQVNALLQTLELKDSA